MNVDSILETLQDDGWQLHDGRKSFDCGVCGTSATVTFGLLKEWETFELGRDFRHIRDIRICPKCEVATTFLDGGQFPRPVLGENFDPKHEEEEVCLIIALYNEARFALSRCGPSCPVLMLRKLLMHVAVHQGSKTNQRFEQYCDFLKEKNVVANPQHTILDRIRKAGNAENHEIQRANVDDASDLLVLVTLLIKSIYFVK